MTKLPLLDIRDNVGEKYWINSKLKALLWK